MHLIIIIISLLLEISNPNEVEIYKELIETQSITYNIPLDESIQRYVVEKCNQSDYIVPEMVFAMMERESMYDASLIGDNGHSYGLLQIQPKWNEERIIRLGVNDLLNPYQNIDVAIDILESLYSTNNNTVWVLMAYNGGGTYANTLLNKGQVSDYALFVLNKMKDIN